MSTQIDSFSWNELGVISIYNRFQGGVKSPMYQNQLHNVKFHKVLHFKVIR